MRILFAFLLLFPLTAFAAFKTGNDLIQLRLSAEAGSPTQYQSQSSIYGYIGGVVDATAGLGVYCLPGSATLGQVQAVVFNYLDENPQYWHLDGSVLIQGALSFNFPCPKKTK